MLDGSIRNARSFTFVHWESNPAGFKFRMKSVGGIEQVAARLAASPSFAKVTLELDRIVKDDFGHKKVADYAFREWGRPNSLHVILFNDPLRSSIVHSTATLWQSASISDGCPQL